MRHVGGFDEIVAREIGSHLGENLGIEAIDAGVVSVDPPTQDGERGSHVVFQRFHLSFDVSTGEDFPTSSLCSAHTGEKEGLSPTGDELASWMSLVPTSCKNWASAICNPPPRQVGGVEAFYIPA